MTAPELLNECLTILKERGQIYNNAIDNTSSFDYIADIASSLNGDVTYERRDVFCILVGLKLQRMSTVPTNNPHYKDSIIDAINYLALMYEHTTV